MSDGRIDWAELLVGRPCPPHGWWVGLAIERGVDALELRASAVVALLALPLGVSTGHAPYLRELPRLAREWIGVCNQHEAFLAAGAAGRKAAERNLAIAMAAREAMEDRRAPEILPELEELYEAAAATVAAFGGTQAEEAMPEPQPDLSHLSLL